jgi:hypothetical protein
MKLKHTQAKKANRPQASSMMTTGMSQWLMGALFGAKQFSESSKNREVKQTNEAYKGQKLGKQLNVQRKTLQR